MADIPLVLVAAVVAVRVAGDPVGARVRDLAHLKAKNQVIIVKCPLKNQVGTPWAARSPEA